MSFMLVIVQKKDAEIANWMTFHAVAKLDNLKELAGVFCIDETAWIFDTRMALPEFGLVTHQASELQIQLYAFHLDDESSRSHVGSYPRSTDLEAFFAHDVRKEPAP